jgi:hypothetical protein
LDNSIKELSSFAYLEDQIQILLILEDLYQFDNIRMILSILKAFFYQVF